jgi:hypothetical protein
MIAAIAALLAYARLVGDSASVDRATLMAAVYFGLVPSISAARRLNALAVVSAVSHRRRSVVGGGPGIHPDVRRHPRDSDRRAGYQRRFIIRTRRTMMGAKISLKTNSSRFLRVPSRLREQPFAQWGARMLGSMFVARRRPRRCSFR